jgi:hypothetical protein
MTIILMLAGVSFAFGADAEAQRRDWIPVSCEESRFAASPPLTCRTTKAWSSDDAHGQFRTWSVRGTMPYIFLVLEESINSIGYFKLIGTTEEFLQRNADRARDGSEFSARATRNGSDYVTFISKEGEDCVGFRRAGPPRSAGYQSMMAGILCQSRGQKLDQARIFEFIDGVKLK